LVQVQDHPQDAVDVVHPCGWKLAGGRGLHPALVNRTKKEAQEGGVGGQPALVCTHLHTERPMGVGGR
jgi:hypothetical protein